MKGTETTRQYNVDLESLNDKTLPTQTQINIYTDGSRTYNHVGAGYVIYDQSTEIAAKSIRLSENTTVFQAELLAIREAATHFIRTKTLQQQYIKIMTDSQAALQALDATEYTSRIVKTTMDELNALGRNFPFQNKACSSKTNSITRSGTLLRTPIHV